MKTMSFALLLVAGTAIVLAGCADNATSVVQPNDREMVASSKSMLGKGDVRHSATGGAHLLYMDGAKLNFSFMFSAIQHLDGSASGEIQFRNMDGFSFRGTVFDLKVDAVSRMAKLSWVYTAGPWVGQTGFVVVIDNGEGKKALASDQISWFVFTDGTDIGDATIDELVAMDPDPYLAWLTPMAGVSSPEDLLTPTTGGNVQVR